MSAGRDQARRYLRAHRTSTVVILAAACLAAGIVTWRFVTPAPSFPDALPGAPSDVSYQQALSDHGITLAGVVRNLRYTASQGTDGYPLDAFFTTDCASAQDFVGVNGLNQVSFSYDLPNADVYVFASAYGWKPGSSGSSWYERPVGTDSNLEVLIQGARGTCTVYLTASQ